MSIELPLLEEMAVYDGETGVVLPCVIQGDMGDDYWLHWYKDDERINTAQNAYVLRFNFAPTLTACAPKSKAFSVVDMSMNLC